MTYTIKLRRGTASEWTSANPVLGSGEPGVETDTGKMKYGDGTTNWNSLSYFSGYQNTDVDGHLNTSTATTNQVLSWNGSDYDWVAQSSGGGGGSATVTIELMKINYSTNGSLSSISNTTSGISSTNIVSSTGGDVEIVFTGYSYPPSNILIYGYNASPDTYVIMPLNKDISTRQVEGSASGGSPTSHGSLGSSKITLKLREADTGASRDFGTTTHAWLHFTMLSS